MIDEYSKEIQNYIKSKLLRPGDEITVTWPDRVRAFDLGEKTPVGDNSPHIFKKHPHIYRGRLLTKPSDHGREPGKYIDRSQVRLGHPSWGSEDSEFAPLLAGIEDIELDPELIKTRLAELSPDDHFISMAADKLDDLPETTHMEADIVAITDTAHEHYASNPDSNQFTIYRVYYGTAEGDQPTKYRLRKGPIQFDITEDQIRSVASGPVRLFYKGEGYKLVWPSVKAEAEYHLLLGRFIKIYNPTTKSYSWDINQAKQLLALGKAHAILQDTFDHYLVTFWDMDIGGQLSSYPDLILDI